MIYTLLVEAADLEIIGQGLDELKFKVAAPVAKKLQAQIIAQEMAAQQPSDKAIDMLGLVTQQG